jgi:hypothetical protein
MTNDYSIAVLLPTRSRTTALTDSVTSLVCLAESRQDIQILFGIDNDDTVGLEHFEGVIQPFLDDHNIAYEALAFETMGYAGLNRYYNRLAESALADWLFVWNDDAVMHTQGWDRIIKSYTGQFKLLKVHTHNEHPYSIFPIVPRAWVELLGHLSRHHMIDAELSQIAFMLDIMQVVEIDVTHNQVELTKNAADPLKPKVRFEGNPANPWDFHNTAVTQQRLSDCSAVSEMMKDNGSDTHWWEEVKAGRQDPWEKLRALDINKQMVQYKVNAN